MYYFQFFIDDNPQQPAARKNRLARLQYLALINRCSCDIENHEGYSTVRIETPDSQDASLFKCLAERPLDAGIYQHNGFNNLHS